MIIMRVCTTCKRRDEKAHMSEVTIAVGVDGEEFITPHTGDCSVLACADAAYA